MKKPFMLALMALLLAFGIVANAGAFADESVLSGSLDLQAATETVAVSTDTVSTVSVVSSVSDTIYISEAVFAPPGDFQREVPKATLVSQITMTDLANYLFAAVITLLATAALAMPRKKEITRRSRDGLMRGSETDTYVKTGQNRVEGSFLRRATA